jgi:hypothetical protein
MNSIQKVLKMRREQLQNPLQRADIPEDQEEVHQEIDGLEVLVQEVVPGQMTPNLQEIEDHFLEILIRVTGINVVLEDD